MEAIAGQTFQVRLSFRKPKTGFVGIYTSDLGMIFSVVKDWAALQRQAADSANFTNTANATVTLTAPAPGTYWVETIVPADGGSLADEALTVTSAPTAAPAPSPSTPPISASGAASTINPWGGITGVYTPPNPEPAAQDGAKLSMQGADLQAYYVANYGPGMLAATQFVIDHNHQLAAIGSGTVTTTSTYTPPPNEPQASDGEKLSMQSPDVQSYYVQKYGPGFLAAVGFVNERNASLGTSIPGGAPTVLPAGPGAGGPDIGLMGGGGDFSSFISATPTVPDQRQTGAPPPSVGGLVAEVTSNRPLLIGLGVAAAAFFLMGGHHRR